MNVHLITPMTWSAALMPLLQDEGFMKTAALDVSVHESGDFPDSVDLQAIYIAFADDQQVIKIAEWALARFLKQGERPLLVVVGNIGLRYEWQLRELGAIGVIGHVWQASQVAAIIRRQVSRLSQPEQRWPASIQKQLPSAMGVLI